MENQGFIRTTIYLSKQLHNDTKIMAVLTNTNMSKFMRVALSEKIKELKQTLKNVPHTKTTD